MWAHRRCDWGLTFYLRADHGGSFHTYPHVADGPFGSSQEALDAADRYLDGRRDRDTFTGVPPLEKAIRTRLYWPDGRRKKHSKTPDATRDSTRQLVHALVDKYNDDHCLSGDAAYELKDIVRHQMICEGDIHKWYIHTNFTARATKGADDHVECRIDDLFFAEVVQKTMQGGTDELTVSCLCVVKPTDDGNCYGCTNNGTHDMKHPSDAAYVGGHTKDTLVPFGGCSIWPPSNLTGDRDEDFKAEEARIRSIYRVIC